MKEKIKTNSMIKINIKPSSEKINDKWIPAGIIRFPSGLSLTERVDRYYGVKCNTKKEADQYFLQASHKRYKTA